MTDARSLKKRSPQEEEGGEEGGAIDHCAPGSAWLNFFAFMTWCEDGTVGAKPPPPEDAPPAPAEWAQLEQLIILKINCSFEQAIDLQQIKFQIQE